MSALTSDSTVWKNTRAPSADAPLNAALKVPLPPVGPVDTSVVCPPARSYTSTSVSVSALTSDSSVWKNTRVPSADAPTKLDSKAPLPPVGPVETSSSTLCSADALEASPAAASNETNPTAAHRAPRPRVDIIHVFMSTASSCGVHSDRATGH